jgi:hypothetical protein
MRELAGQKRRTRRDAHARIAQERLDPRPRRRPRPRSVGVFCGEESPIASQLFCPVCLIVKHRDSRGRRTTTSTRTTHQLRRLTGRILTFSSFKRQSREASLTARKQSGNLQFQSPLLLPALERKSTRAQPAVHRYVLLIGFRIEG